MANAMPGFPGGIAFKYKYKWLRRGHDISWPYSGDGVVYFSGDYLEI